VRDVEKRTTDISARAEWIDRWMEKIARAVRLGSKDSGEVGEAREREREREGMAVRFFWIQGMFQSV